MKDYSKLLEGKKALITSGAHGMGYAIAKVFVKQGADVAVCGRSPTGVESEEKLRQVRPGTDSFFFQCDMADGDDVDAFCAETLKRFGHVDIIVNNVGINMREPVWDITFEKFDTVQATNFRGIVRINNNILPSMIERGEGGSVIHISTVHSLATLGLMGSYVASKGAMNAFSRLMAVELGEYGIRSNVVAPGGVFTMPSINNIKEWMRNNPGKSYKDEMRPVNPQGGDALLGPGHAEDIAHACLYLASDMGKYVSGSKLMVDGGASYQAHKSVEPFPVPDYYEEMALAYRDTFPYPEEADL